MRKGLLAIVFFGMSFQLSASEAEEKFNDELANCAAYYQIASETIASMNAPQMKAVGKRLASSAEQAQEIARQYQPKEKVQQSVDLAKNRMLASLNGSSSLGPLMGKYKKPCQTILAEPKKRLDYWVMATM